eukprot:COSAG04_NODE_12717_length_638_cov_1.148423_1_plen_66_part_10
MNVNLGEERTGELRVLDAQLDQRREDEGVPPTPFSRLVFALLCFLLNSLSQDKLEAEGKETIEKAV